MQCNEYSKAHRSINRVSENRIAGIERLWHNHASSIQLFWIIAYESNCSERRYGLWVLTLGGQMRRQDVRRVHGLLASISGLQPHGILVCTALMPWIASETWKADYAGHKDRTQILQCAGSALRTRSGIWFLSEAWR